MVKKKHQTNALGDQEIDGHIDVRELIETLVIGSFGRSTYYSFQECYYAWVPLCNGQEVVASNKVYPNALSWSRINGHIDVRELIETLCMGKTTMHRTFNKVN